MEELKQKIEEAFSLSVTNGCIQNPEGKDFTPNSFGIRDDSQPGDSKAAYLCSYDDGHLRILNSLGRKLYFWAIDSCTFQPKDPKRCDVALWSDDQLVLAEIKTSGKRKRKDSRTTAINQLKSSFDLINRILDPNMTKHAIIVFVAAKTHPARLINRAEISIQFEQEFQAQLLEGNTFTFN